MSKKDLDSNIVYVSRAYYDEGKQRNSFQCSSFNWLGDDRPMDSSPLFCKVRHGPSMYRCAASLLLPPLQQIFVMTQMLIRDNPRDNPRTWVIMPGMLLEVLYG